MLDYAYANALPVWTGSYRAVSLTLVGCGGTGSFLAPMLGRLMLALQHKGFCANAVFIDPDSVEPKNVPRQNFVPPDMGRNKAQVLATRYSLAYGLSIGAIAEGFEPEMVHHHWQSLSVVISCVDNSIARTKLSQLLQGNNSHCPNPCWWIDCGNYGKGIPAGQVLIGSLSDFSPESAFNDPNHPNVCLHLPSPALQCPQMLIAESNESSGQHLSCAEMALLNEQNLFVNQRVACLAIEYLSQLTLTRNLKRFATYFHAGAGSERSHYTDPITLRNFFPLK